MFWDTKKDVKENKSNDGYFDLCLISAYWQEGRNVFVCIVDDSLLLSSYILCDFLDYVL